ncbi:glycerophosphoryl diester phosphodiesterase [Stackebrandtia albiflava]|uniref:Glycerophosphoryl diester phosphodiesterase n=1 Tax=Stackebrandtia albiflava TaxID=406432 RepID=A0A562V3K6_9ACTN|nr:glycerophosphodiester phosphodiesterase family protein [Stackebrandtia albiflava]TWJ12418.1 glycerophosphoryl diester phosphodiesterase [Stackebrandtia albiflava]
MTGTGSEPVAVAATEPPTPDVSTAPGRPWWRRKRYRFGIVLVLVAGYVYAVNSSWLAGDPGEGPGVLAHRGVAQTFDVAGVGDDTCTAEIIHEPAHGYLENTLPGIRAAFDAGAEVVELDVHITADGQFAVFHDWEVDCRTEGSGTTRDFTMAELKRLDVGHGYTFDGGETFPFRGKGVGMMPSLTEVLAEFPVERLLIHVKSDDPAEGEALAEYLSTVDEKRVENLTVYGGDRPIAALRERMPDLRVMSKEIMTDCLLRYEVMAWTGMVPDACHHTQLHIPEGYAPWLWGWPVRFAERMAEVDTVVVLVAGDGGFSEGFDSADSLDRIPDGFTGLVWTNDVTEIAPLLSGR